VPGALVARRMLQAPASRYHLQQRSEGLQALARQHFEIALVDCGCP
jgi:hypothetical protein